MKANDIDRWTYGFVTGSDSPCPSLLLYTRHARIHLKKKSFIFILPEGCSGEIKAVKNTRSAHYETEKRKPTPQGHATKNLLLIKSEFSSIYN